MVNNKGYLKTIEAIFAILILFSVVLFLVNKVTSEDPKIPDDIKSAQDSVQNLLEIDKETRINLIQNNTQELNQSISPLIPKTLEYKFTICPSGPNLPCSPPDINKDKTVYVSSFIVSPDLEGYSNTLFRLFLYRRV